ncbi:MAG: SHOCT domain-containing protein [Chloroflexi bacterium]|nr:SHOCT domain-containing protein [Chloroflexota bacterium]
MGGCTGDGSRSAWLWMVFLWGGLIWLIVWGIRSLSGQAREPGGKSAIEIARERYARGKITKEQFEEVKQPLSA